MSLIPATPRPPELLNPMGLEPHQVMVMIKKLSEQFAIGAGDVMEVCSLCLTPRTGAL